MLVIMGVSGSGKTTIAPGLAELYGDSKPATLRRYGETDDKSEELI